MRKIILLLGLLASLPVGLFGQAGSYTTLRSGATLPAACSPGGNFFKTTAPIGTHECTATNTWTFMGGRFTQTGTGAVARTVDAKLKDFKSITDFGAVSGSGDDTAAIQAAVDAGSTLIPAGAWTIDGTVTVPSNRSLFCLGQGVSIITKNGTGCGFDFDNNDYINMEKCDIGAGTGGDSTSHGICSNEGALFKVESTHVHGFVGHNILITSPVDVELEDVKSSASTLDGLRIDDGTTPRITGGYYNANGGNGITIVNGVAGTMIIGTVTEENTGWGISATIEGSLLAGNESEQNTAGGYQLTGYGNSITGNTLSPTGTGIAGVGLVSSSIMGNDFGSQTPSISFDATSSFNWYAGNDKDGGGTIIVTDSGSSNTGFQLGTLNLKSTIKGIVSTFNNAADNGLNIYQTDETTIGARIRLRNSADNDVGNVLNIVNTSTSEPTQFWTDGAVALTLGADQAVTVAGTLTMPTPFTLGATSVTPTGTELNHVAGVTSGIQGQLDAKPATAGDGLTLTGTDIDCDTSSATVFGCTEHAIASEVDGGAALDRSITPDALAGSTIFGRKTATIVVFPDATALTTGDGKFYFPVPEEWAGMNIVAVSAHTGAVNSSSGAITVDLARCAAVATGIRCSGTVADILSTNLTIDSGEDGSETAAAAVIDLTNDDVPAAGHIRIDVDAIGTGTQGLIVRIAAALL